MAQQERPYTVEYYYKAKWGYAEEFIRLLKKKSLPNSQETGGHGKAPQHFRRPAAASCFRG